MFFTSKCRLKKKKRRNKIVLFLLRVKTRFKKRNASNSWMIKKYIVSLEGRGRNDFYSRFESRENCQRRVGKGKM